MWIISSILSALCILVSAFSADACDVPVFRYAMDYWEPDVYEAVIFHKDPVDEQATGKIAELGALGSLANLKVRTVDIAKPMDPPDRLLWVKQSAGDRLPWMLVKSASLNPEEIVVWSGSLMSARPQQLIDSPVRAEIARRLLDGQSAVWVLLESGDREQDDAAADRLRTTLASEPQRLELPIPTDEIQEEDPVSERPEPRIEFSLMRLSRDTEEEQVLGANLLQSEWDLALSQGPIAFPVFGRGRVLYALVGAGINETNIQKACAFLVGACSCTIKDLSPGQDLLMSADWGPVITNELPSYADIQSAVEQYAADATASVDQRPVDSVSVPQTGSLGRNLLLILAIVGSGVAVATFFMRAGARKDRSRS